MFKVGDKVIVKGWLGDTSYYEGATGTVNDTSYFAHVLFDHRPDKMLLVSLAELELVKPEPQAAAIAGGLQEHSVGEYCPLAAVMYEHNGESIITIENLQTGEVAAVGDHASDWSSFEFAYSNIEAIAKGGNWLRTKGRVSYVNGRWVVAEPANPVRVTRLRNMLHRG